MAIARFSLLLPGRTLFGRGVAGDAAAVLAAMGRRVFVVHGADAGRAAWLLHDLRAAGVAVEAVACPKEPTLDLLDAALGQARAFGAQAVVGLGGGAVLDLAKAVAGLAPGQGAPMDHLEVVGKGLPLTAPPLPFVAIPTTAGTGAEATKNAVIDVPAHRRKVSLRDDRMMARLAIVDPALTDDCPRGVTLASGLDAVTQVIEPYLCTRANPATDALCAAAIPMGLGALARLMAGEDPDARDAMAWVSHVGGIALANAGLGAVHGLAGVIGGLTGAAHGAVCGALLPAVLAENRAALRPGAPVADRFDAVAAMIAAALGCAPGDAFESLAGWSRDAGLPGLAAMGVSASDHAAIAEAALGSSSMKANPADLGVAGLIRAMERAA